jgi:LDH2 family malate/lactate/ureidoglycolate dehydrogenase
MSDPGPNLSPSALLQLTRAVLEAVGTPPDIAEVVGSSLIDANLAGVDSHGVIRIPRYVGYVRSGKVLPAARPRIVSLSGATAKVDGASGWGQPAAYLGLECVLALASKNGVGCTTIARCNHIGRLGEYMERIAEANMIGMAMCNSLPAVAPFGGSTRVLGTNPIAFSVPRADALPPIVVDFATAAYAEGKLLMARARGEQLPLGVLLNHEGQPSTDPQDYYAGGALLTFGQHKGYGLSVIIEAIAGLLSGAAASCLPEYDGGNGTVLAAFDIGAFVPLDRFINQCEAMCTVIRSSPPVPGFTHVVLPGEPEAESRKRRSTDGIPLPAQVWAEIKATAEQVGVAADSFLGVR